MGIESLVLAVDDEAGILKLIKMELLTQGFRVLTASDGEAALEIIERQRPDAVVLDLLMPGMNGLEVMKKIRARVNTPIILLTARDRDEDIVRGLELGADDYLPKPFNPAELSARVRAIIRRDTRIANAESIRMGNVELDLEARTIHKDGQPLRLTRTEWKLLQNLASRPGAVVPNEELLTKVWGPEFINDLQYLRVWVSKLRSKIEENPQRPKYLRTLQGIGYLLDPTGSIDEGADRQEAPLDERFDQETPGDLVAVS